MSAYRKPFTRRDFLRSAAGVAVGSALVPLVGCDSGVGPSSDSGPFPDSGLDAGERDSGSDRDSGGDRDSGSGQALVGIARGDTVEDAIRKAVGLTSGLAFIRSGDTVLLKPNMNSDDPFPYTTNPAVVAAVVTLALEAGAGRVVVGDRSNGGYDTIAAMRTTGLYDAATDAGAEVMGFDDASYTSLEPDGVVSWPSAFQVPEFVVSEVDHVINLPCLKHHFMANYTGALKNWVGLLRLSDRGMCHADLGRRIPEIHLGVRESFIIVDGTLACLEGGPFPGGAQAEPNLYVATADPIANDVTSIALLKHYDSPEPVIRDIDVWEQPQIQHAIEIGLGIGRAADYTALGDGVPELDQILSHIV